MRADEGVALFYYQAKKSIDCFAAALGGLDTLLFAGGIGKNAPLVRARLCRALGLGMASGKRNSDHATKCSSRLDLFSADGIPMIHGWGINPTGYTP